jgi:hypothetical protein
MFIEHPKSGAGIPIPLPENVREEAILDAVIGEIEQDVEETEDLPVGRPEEDKWNKRKMLSFKMMRQTKRRMKQFQIGKMIVKAGF